MTASLTIERPPFGKLTWDDDLGWWECAGVPVPLFGSQVLSISFSTGDDADGNPAHVTEEMFAAAEAMLRLDSSALMAITPHAWANYMAFRDAVGEEDVIAIDPSTDIWTLVQPGSIMVEWYEGEGVYVSFECNCDWEIEHGLMLVLKDGVRWVKVSNYDGHVTDGHAYAKPLLDAWIADPNAPLPIRSFDEIMATPGGPKRH